MASKDDLTKMETRLQQSLRSLETKISQSPFTTRRRGLRKRSKVSQMTEEQREFHVQFFFFFSPFQKKKKFPQLIP
jgi:hypothetical protein